MRTSFRQTVITTTAIIGLSAFAAVAAPPTAGNPTAVHPVVATSDQSAAAGHGKTSQVEQRINDLHARLQITSAQQSQWDQFIQVMRDNARDMDQTFQTRIQSMPTMTAAENMQSYAQVAAEHSQDMQKLSSVFQTLYGSMSDSQKRTADQVFRDDSANHGDHARHG
jgi:periplasmic protein CpxP/Spy